MKLALLLKSQLSKSRQKNYTFVIPELCILYLLYTEFQKLLDDSTINIQTPTAKAHKS